MKTHTETLPVERSGLQTEGSFTIKATSKAFDILSSGLYSDKIQAIVRELSCNAHDSHVAAGKGDQPIEIRLPSSLEPTFYVKDYGLGMSHEDVLKLYTTYFESTKTNSDDFIGQLGLGSKSPFSYSSTFLVESRFNGTKRTYSCFKNEQNMPAIAMMNEQATDEHNGMTVTLAVRREDVDKFHAAAKKALMYFKPLPKIVGRSGFAPYSLKHTVQGNGWRIRDTEYYAGMSGAHVVQGFVAYPVDGHQLEQTGMSPIAAALTTIDIDMFVPIGKVEVAASREALSYDKRTITNLIASFEAAAKEMRTSFQAEFDKCTSIWEVAMMLDKLENGTSQKFRSIFRDMNKTNPFQWNGKDVTTTVKLDLTKIKDTQIQRLSTSYGRKATKLNVNGQWHPVNSTAKSFEFDLQANTFVFVDNEAKGAVNAIKDYLSNLPEVDGRKASMILLRPTTKQAFRQKEIDAIVKMLGSPVVKSVDELPSASVQRKKYTAGPKRAAEEKLVFTKFATQHDYRGRANGVRRTFSRLTWETQQVDMNAGGFYVELERFTPVTKSAVSVDHLDEMIAYGKALGLLPPDAIVVGMNEKDMKSLAKSSGDWHELFPYLIKAFKKANKGGAMYSKMVVDQVMADIGNGVRDHLVNKWDKLEATVLSGQFKDAIQELVDLTQSAGKYDPKAVERLTQVLRIEREPDVRVTEMPKAFRKALSHYELLGCVEMGYYNDKWVKPVISYVNMIDKK
jgi:hypothetical protein